MNRKYIIVFDFETDGANPQTCNPVELAAIPIEPRKLEILYDHKFNTTIKPPEIDEDSYFTDERKKTIEWHAKQRNTTTEKIVEYWKTGLDEKLAWNNFIKFCENFTIDKSSRDWYPEPIPAGYNIINFDLVIAKRLNDKYKTKFPLSPVQKIDAFDMLFTWFENLDEPYNLKMDTLRQFFQMNNNGQAHEGIVDTIDEALIITKFLNFQRKQASVQKFRGAFNK